MQKPAGYDEAQSLGDFETLEAGGYICRIVGAREEVSRAGKKMLVIAFDIDEGEHKDFYKRRYERAKATNANAKWQGTYRQMLEGENALGYLKGVITSIEESNNFTWDWNEENLKGKIFGGVFGREQYMSDIDMSLRFTTRIRQIRSVEAIKKGNFKIPQDKLLEGVKQDVDDSFVTIEDDEDLPF